MDNLKSCHYANRNSPKKSGKYPQTEAFPPPNKCAEQQFGHSRPIRARVVMEEDIWKHALTANGKKFQFLHVAISLSATKGKNWRVRTKTKNHMG
ncbi:hypothetical protein TNCT_56581 [Trichonephila clavata]|uniref:Uncharacterized protein n=1 Tax=Trichonephila clavata TaxID=2740835 RepID=A0A8X6KXU2_TRICU|nr:hypothetical protein TNCT_56581 [Trichonephila clavata]